VKATFQRTGTAALGLLVLATLTSCGDEADEAEADRPTATPSESTGPFDVRLEITDGPDWMADGFGSLWVKRDDGSVMRVAADGGVEATIDAEIFQQPVCQGLGVTDTAVWACATGGTLIRIDPATNEFTTVDVPKSNDQGRLTSSGGLLWLLTGDGDKLQGLTDEGEISTTIQLGTFCTDVSDTAPGGVLWVACSYEGIVLRVDLEAGEITGRVGNLPLAARVSVGDDVWVGFERGLARIDAKSAKVLDTKRMEVAGLRVTPESVLVRGTGAKFLTALDPLDGQVIDTWPAPELTSGGDVIAVDGRIWATAYDDNAMVRLRE